MVFKVLRRFLITKLKFSFIPQREKMVTSLTMLSITVTMNASNIPADCKGSAAPVGGIYCKKIEYLDNNTIIANLTPATNYQFLLVVCQTVACGTIERIVSVMKFGATLPTLASFNGVEQIKLANNVSEIGKVYLKVTPPDFNTGYFDGYIIGYKSDLLLPAFDRISETATLPVTPYDYTTANYIEVGNINYNGVDNYCFTVYPFVYDNLGGKIEFENDIWQCSTATVEAPTIDQFPGIDQAISNKSNISLLWNLPAAEVYSHIEIFWRKTAGGFDFSEAINETTVNYTFANYDRAIVPGTESQYLIENLPNGTYKVGVLSYYANGINGIERSEFNIQTFECIVNSAGVPTDCNPL